MIFDMYWTNNRQTLADFIPLPTIQRLNPTPRNPDLEKEMAYNPTDESFIARNDVENMNDDQRHVYKTIMDAHSSTQACKVYVVDAPGVKHLSSMQFSQQLEEKARLLLPLHRQL